jgi:ABC-type branched-subunit amino acid transport system ATPase component
LVIEQQVDHALALADHVIVLERGRIVSSGPPDQIDAVHESFR